MGPLDIIETSAMLRDLPADLKAALADRLVPRALEGGEVLLREGDEVDGMYLVQAGRLRAQVQVGDDVEVLGEIGRGEVVGESALLSDQRRTATVVALRDSELWHLPVQAFEELVAAHPSFLRPVAAQVVERLVASRHALPPSQSVRTIAVVPLHGTEVALAGVVHLADTLAAVSDGGVVITSDDRPEDGGDAAWIQTLEARHELVVFRCDPSDEDSTRRFLRQADLVVLVADAEQQPGTTPPEAALAAHRADVDLVVELVLVHPADRDEVRGTSRWLDGRRVRRHHHVHAGHEGDVARVARLLTNRAIGLVCSGGGARSMAEIGVAQVMAELGIPIDAVGGTSAGAVVAGALARGWSVERVRAMLHDGTVVRGSPLDLTVPLTSLAAGRRMTDRLREAAGDVDIRDLWLPFYCVSTNLSRNRPQIHRSGPAWRAVRASSSIPGVFPPVADQGDLLVDGGLVDNLPVAEMRRAHEGITVIAVDVGVQRGLVAGDLPDSTVLDGWRMVRDRLDPRRRTPQIAGVLSILARLSELGGGNHDGDRGDVLVRPDVERFPILDFDRFDELVDVGRRQGRLVLDDWWADRVA